MADLLRFEPVRDVHSMCQETKDRHLQNSMESPVAPTRAGLQFQSGAAHGAWNASVISSNCDVVEVSHSLLNNADRVPLRKVNGEPSRRFREMMQWVTFPVSDLISFCASEWSGAITSRLSVLFSESVQSLVVIAVPAQLFSSADSRGRRPSR